MSKTNSLHYQLCLEGAKWLHRQKRDINRCPNRECYKPDFCQACYKYKWVAVELCVYGAENADVWGYDGIYTAVIEVKTSHADFLADAKKWWRSDVAKGYDLHAGTYRWYLCPEGVIKPEELPEGWGLLYWNGKKIERVVAPARNEHNWKADMRIFYSIIRRERFPEKIYNYREEVKEDDLALCNE